MSRDQAVQRAIEVAILMAQELQEFVDDAIQASGDPTALSATQELLKDWEDAFRETGMSWQSEILKTTPSQGDSVIDAL